MTEKNKKRVRQSFIAGSLTSSAGIFLSKAIGLFYVVPFTSLATENNMVFYSSAYTYYNVLLQICSAGLPFAIAAIIAKYVEREDYKTVMLVRKLSTGILSVSGFLMMMIFACVSGPLSRSILGAGSSDMDIQRMQTTFIILSVALFLVPVLYSYRGFYQGLKDLRVYANSQVIEQFARVIFLLGAGWFVVRVLKMDSIWAVYMAVTATSIAAITAIIYYVRYDRRNIGKYRRAAREQTTEPVDHKQLAKELLAFGFPYLISSIFGNSQTLINTNFFIPVMTSQGMDQQTAQLLYGIIQVQCDKITSIPQVLGIGFSSGVVPYMTVSYEQHNYKELNKNIRECLDTVFYIGLPICFMIFALARPIYYVMYGGANLDYGADALAWSSLLALATTITPICSSMMMTLHLRKESIFYLFVGFVVKCISFYPLLKYTGYSGAITSSVLCSVVIIYLSLAKISNRFGVSYAKTAARVFKMLLCCIAMNGVFALLNLAGFTFSESSRAVALLQLAGVGILGAFSYAITSSILKLPQAIFHMPLGNLVKRLLKKN